ncbi:PAAR domain-containing protein [Achromobacter sp. PAB15]|uniref:PAAR domain-containing protein n=1 Tax=Achromobacter sp. PAB15 TaxID=3233048 RepID=UPI003F938103
MAGLPIVRMGDSTTHGGTVLQGVDQYTIDGRLAAGLGHLVSCPKCEGTFPIVQGVAAFTVDGVALAVEGMRTSCGAELIASQGIAFLEPGPGEFASQPLWNPTRHTPCNHPDTVLGIAEYMAREMKTNPFSIRGREIYDANHYDLAAHVQQREALPWYARATAGKSYSEAVVERKLAAYALWADIVGPGQPWDHKPFLRANLVSKGIFNRGWLKYRDSEYFFDIWSNIHYGYVGVALGFSATELIHGAGLAQALDDYLKDRPQQHHPEHGAWPASADDVPDHISITLGTSLYDEVKPHELTVDVLLEKIEAVALPWGAGKNQAKRRHRCEFED